MFIWWAELTETEVKDFKKRIVFDKGSHVLPACVSFTVNGEEDFINKLLSWSQFSKKEVENFYSILLEKLDQYFENTETNTKLVNIKHFMSGFSLSEEEIKGHKKKLVSGSGNIVAFLIVRNRWDEVEELLDLCFSSSEKEIIEFKEKLPFKVSKMCLDLILNKKFDDVDKFFTWTGIHHSLKKRVLRSTVFDDRIFQMVAVFLMDSTNENEKIRMECKNDSERFFKWLSEMTFL